MRYAAAMDGLSVLFEKITLIKADFNSQRGIGLFCVNNESG